MFSVLEGIGFFVYLHIRQGCTIIEFAFWLDCTSCRLERYISNLQERPTIEELSKEYLINTATLKDTFKGVYGQPIGTYMKVYRMKQAAALLRQTQATIAEIASRVGYENQSKFATAFRDVMKIAPAEYRKQNSGDWLG